jgi:ABC-type multidrug transport system ATPase subunit
VSSWTQRGSSEDDRSSQEDFFSDVESAAARLLLLAGGRLVWDGTPDALIARARGRVFETIVDEDEARAFNRLHRITTRVRIAEGVRLRGIVAEGRVTATATLEEAYLAEIAPRQRIVGASFAFVYEEG